jgi:hypothetical protein
VTRDSAVGLKWPEVASSNRSPTVFHPQLTVNIPLDPVHEVLPRNTVIDVGGLVFRVSSTHLPNIFLSFNSMGHPCLNVDEILRTVASELVESGAKATAVALARCCKNFEEPVLDPLWETQERLLPLLKSFPGDVWNLNEAGYFVSALAVLV